MNDKENSKTKTINEFKKIYEDSIKASTEVFLFSLNIPPNGLKEIMINRDKRLKMLYFLFGVIDCTLKDRIEKVKLISDESTGWVDDSKWRNKQVFDYFINVLEYPADEVFLIPVTLSHSPVNVKISALNYDNPNELGNLVNEGGNAYLRMVETRDKTERRKIMQYLNKIRYGEI